MLDGVPLVHLVKLYNANSICGCDATLSSKCAVWMVEVHSQCEQPEGEGQRWAMADECEVDINVCTVGGS